MMSCASPSMLEFDSPEEFIDLPRDTTTIVRFSSPSAAICSSSSPLNHQINIPKVKPIDIPSNPDGVLQSPYILSPISQSSPNATSLYSSILLSPELLSIPKSLSPQLQSARSHPVQFFLQFHRERITEAHYFRWYDYPKLCTKILFSMAERSESLRHAMVGFSALVYSYKFHHGAREVGFYYYEKALQQLRLFLNTSPMELEECLTAVATALQLSTFDVIFPLPLSFRFLIDSVCLENRKIVFDISKVWRAFYKREQLLSSYVQQL